MQVEGTVSHYRDVDVQALAVAVFKDESPREGILKELDELTGGLVSSVLDAEELKGKDGETALLHLSRAANLKAERLLLVGVGERSDYNTAKVSQMAGTAARCLRSKGIKSVALLTRGEGDAEKIASAAVEGAFMGLFDPDKYRTVEKETRQIERLVIVDGSDAKALKQGIERGQVIGEAVNFTRDLANEPGAYMTPTIMAERAREIAGEFGLSIDV